jgi:hypothetical protein
MTENGLLGLTHHKEKPAVRKKSIKKSDKLAYVKHLTRNEPNGKKFV